MSLQHLLLVDDSEAQLAFQSAALGGHFAISTATNGREALQRLPSLQPAAVLLDLSMPEVNGEEVLAAMQLDPLLRRIPVIVVSAEHARGEACLKNGARAFLGKPLRAADLLPLVERVLAAGQAEARKGNLAVLFVEVGKLELGLPLQSVLSVLHQIETQRLPFGPSYLNELIELRGAPVCVLDLACRLGVPHAQPRLERKLVVVSHSGLSLALCVDSVRDPEELAAGEITLRADLGGAEHGALQEALVGIARTPRGQLPLVDPRAFVSRSLLKDLANRLPALRREAVAAETGRPPGGAA